MSHDLDLTLAKLTLPLLALLAILGTFILSYTNGFLSQLLSATDSSYLPDSSNYYRLKHHWTGIELIDKLCVQFIAFFWPVVNGVNPSLSLQAVHFLGMGYSVWILVLLEGARTGNKGRAVALVTITGLLIENLLMALTLPFYFLLHLSTSPTVTSFAANTPIAVRADSLAIDTVTLNLIPYSVVLGAGVPTLAVLLSPRGSEQQQMWLVLRQIHPLITGVVLFVLSYLYRRLVDTSMPGSSATETTTETTTATVPATTNKPNQNQHLHLLRALNRVYTFATFLAATSHIATFTLILTSQLTRNVLAIGYRAYFSPSAVFAPPPPLSLFSSHSHSCEAIGSVTFAQGAHIFLKYDQLVSCAAVLVWAGAVNRVGTATSLTLNRQGLGWMETAKAMVGRLKTMQHWRTQGTLLFWLVVGGPAAAAVQLMKQRDEWVLGGEGEEVEVEAKRKRAVGFGEVVGGEGEGEGTGVGEYRDE